MSIRTTTTSRPWAMASVAMHDAVNATLGQPNYAFLNGVVSPGGDSRAATATAAHAVLLHAFPARAADLDAALAASLALVADGQSKTDGIATGAAYAAAVIANRTGDGSGASVAYVPSGLPGRWAPTPPGFAPPAVPHWAAVDPWLMVSPDALRPAPPPAITSDAYTAAFKEVRDIGSVGSLLRDADQSNAVIFWAGAAGTGPWVRAAIDAAESAGHDTLTNAATLAKLTVAIADVTIAVWDSKYHEDYWRPVTAIRAADTDGNPNTDAVADWTPFINTPPHPSYVSAHAGVSGAAQGILTDAFGSGGSFCLTWAGNSRCWDDWADAVIDAKESRLWGGIHWRFDNDVGLDVGYQVAAFTLSQNAFNAVPEPATWAMMIQGFGLVGVVHRRRPIRAITA